MRFTRSASEILFDLVTLSRGYIGRCIPASMVTPDESGRSGMDAYMMSLSSVPRKLFGERLIQVSIHLKGKNLRGETAKVPYYMKERMIAASISEFLDHLDAEDLTYPPAAPRRYYGGGLPGSDGQPSDYTEVCTAKILNVIHALIQEPIIIWQLNSTQISSSRPLEKRLRDAPGRLPQYSTRWLQNHHLLN